MIHVYIGDGKGKTTASVGLSVRAAGHGLKVLFLQFLKDSSSGEVKVLTTLPEISVVHASVNYGWLLYMTDVQKKEIALEYDKMLDTALASDAFLIVLDEVIHAFNAGLISRDKLEKVLDKECEIVLTGRDAPTWLIDRADYCSEIKKIKHPFDVGVHARAGIEF